MSERNNDGNNAAREESSSPNAESGENSNEPSSSTDARKMMNEMAYCFSSFHAIITPVSLCMVLSALAVVFINTDETREQGQQAFADTYEVIDLEEGNSSQNFVASVANTLIIVSVICAMTFVVVLLYKYRCMKIFLGYMIFVTAMLLGYLTSSMWIVAIEKYGWKIDKFSFAFVMYNYAIVGTVAIFWPTGIPKWVSQGYLIASSVVLAWQLSFFGEWTAWTLLVVLALYDLFAVLTPCGPLKALANMMSSPGAPVLPGLLYEASLPEGVQKPKRKGNDENQEGGENGADGATAADETPSSSTTQQDSSVSVAARNQPDVDSNVSNTANTNSQPPEPDSGNYPIVQSSSAGGGEVETIRRDEQPVNITRDVDPTASNPSSARRISTSGQVESVVPEPDTESVNIGKVPLAIAKMYKLPVIDEDGVLRPKGRNVTTWQRDYTPDEIRSAEWTPKQLRKEVSAIFPHRGGRIERSDETSTSFDEGPQYKVYNRSGALLRTFVVNREGRVMEVVKRDTKDDSPEDNSIKLGLGDFIFYSVLVSKAALYSFTSFAACMVVILFGLMATLVLLAMHGKALPALPISIFLGVAMFFLTRFFTEPWIQAVLRLPFYV